MKNGDSSRTALLKHGSSRTTSSTTCAKSMAPSFPRSDFNSRQLISPLFSLSLRPNNNATDPQKCREAVSILCRVARQVHNLQKYRDETAKDLSWKHDHERIKRKNEKDAETTREIYSAKDIPDSPNDDSIVPRRNYMPRDWDTLPEPLY
jgi:hypothetical protein